MSNGGTIAKVVPKESNGWCISCTKLKIKCNVARPKCEHCEHTNLQCVYIRKSTVVTTHHTILPLKKKNRCLSCRKLKIKCDEARPKCEYCEHTGRECIYLDSRRKSVPRSNATKKNKNRDLITQTSPSGLWFNQMCLNSTARHLNMSQLELRLLDYFQGHYIESRDTSPLRKIWTIEVPKLWQLSDIVRQSIYSLSAMHLWAVCDMTPIMQKDITHSDQKKASFLKDINNEVLGIHPGLLKAFLYDKTGEYFTNCLNRTNELMNLVAEQNCTVTSKFQAAEILISGILLYSFLTQQPHLIVPLLADNPASPDVISICKGMKTSIYYGFETLRDSPYGEFIISIFERPAITEKDKYPLVEYLRDQFESYRQSNSLLHDQSKILTEAIDLLEVGFYRALRVGNAYPIYRWQFLVDIKFHDLVKIDKNYFAIKLMFFYAALCLICKYRIDRNRNIWIDFMNWYRDYNLVCFGKWFDSYDQELYEVATETGFEINEDNLYLLETFIPLIYL